MQLQAQMIGSIASVFVSLFAFDLYRSLYTIPGKSFPVPASAIWRDMSELLNEGIGSLAPRVLPFVVLGMRLKTVVRSNTNAPEYSLMVLYS
mmetsp:Transcript_39454/g.156679  ORF Transcript_39454/g.156679 Transcript_39454/m.156679 type:complete len:92 (+) Transcript_39454:212-487(+)